MPEVIKTVVYRLDELDEPGRETAHGWFRRVIATLFAFSRLSFRDRSDRMANAYARLYAFAGDHPEAEAIFGPID